MLTKPSNKVKTNHVSASKHLSEVAGLYLPIFPKTISPLDKISDLPTNPPILVRTSYATPKSSSREAVLTGNGLNPRLWDFYGILYYKVYIYIYNINPRWYGSGIQFLGFSGTRDF